MEQLFLNWFLVFVRAGAMLSIFPLFSASAVPVRLRIALAGFISLLVIPSLGAPPVDPTPERARRPSGHRRAQLEAPVSGPARGPQTGPATPLWSRKAAAPRGGPRRRRSPAALGPSGRRPTAALPGGYQR